LAEAAAAGNPRAVEDFVLATGPCILRVVRRILGAHHPDTEDVVQDATFAALDALADFRGQCTVLHFVWRVAALTAMNARRRLQLRQHITPGLEDADVHASDEPSPMGNALAARRREVLRRLLDELPAVQAEALGLHCVLGYTIEETAATAGVPPNTVRSRLIAAKAALRERLAETPELYDLVRGVS
jgi:RNA polymerase sigma factor (sigma-70 family)